MSNQISASLRLRHAWPVWLLATLLPVHALAAVDDHVSQPLYLSDWLVLAQRNGMPLLGSAPGKLYTPGLAWFSQREALDQAGQWQRLIWDIRADVGDRQSADPARRGAHDRLLRLILDRPPTGRVLVKSTDPHWLQTNRNADPYLERGDRVVIPERPDTVTVIRADGTLCRLPHVPGAQVRDYIVACNARARPDTAWIAQPDGQVLSYGVALWNREAQDPPAPGSWIWAPDRGDGWPDELSQRIVTFFAQQGVSGVDADFKALPAPDVAAPPLATAFWTGLPQHDTAFPVTGSDWGNVGILQTPTARMNQAGEGSLSVTHIQPYTRVNFTLQPLDWLEFGFRYTDVSDHLYGSVALSGNQTYKDKSIDAKIRLFKETVYTPDLSVGVRDLGGTGLFSGEYVVASKRTGDLDWSLGLGWGYVGARGNLKNPFSLISSKFDTRSASTVDTGGELSTKSYFRGPTSLFGGVQYQTPWTPLILKLEYDGNDYKHEPFGDVFPTRSPLNVGAVYRINGGLDLTVAYERGERVMLGLALHGNLKNAAMPKVFDPVAPTLQVYPATDLPNAPVSAAPIITTTMAQHPAPAVAAPPDASPAPAAAAPPVVDWKQTRDDIELLTHWHVQNIRLQGQVLLVEFDDLDAFYLQDGIDRIVKILNRDAPATVTHFHLLPLRHGLMATDYRIDRAIWLNDHTRARLPSQHVPALASVEPAPAALDRSLPSVFEQTPKRFDYSIGPTWHQSLGGPDAFMLYQLSANAQVEFRFTPSLWVVGDLNVGLLDNYDKFKYDAPSNMPRVRTNVREYVTSSRVTMPYLQATKVGQLGSDNYYSVYGGLLESMFAGVGGEWLYRPHGSPLAIGVDLNAVKQRGFDQDFSMRDYQTFTGHLTAYWDTRWQGVQANISVGQYLAKDKGVTLEVTRHFRNGVVIGVYATKTNVSAQTFGEGSFDKGIYLTIPFDAMMARSGGDVGLLRWNPVTRDGGAKLARQYSLYDMTNLSDDRSLWHMPPAD